MSSEEVVKGIGMIISGLVIAFVMTSVMGLFVDTFMYELLHLNIQLTPEFQEMLQYPMQIIDIFYFVPLLFSVLLIVWGFKLIVFEHKYGREKGEEYW